MQGSLHQELKGFAGFEPRDAANVASLAEYIRPAIPEIVRRFDEKLFSHPAAWAVFTGGQEQVARQRSLLAAWLAELFSGTYDDSYFQRRSRIGETHVRVGLPQRYMFLGMELIWQQLQEALRRAAPENLDEKLASLHKLLSIDLTTMLESYQRSYTDRARRFERAVMEEKLTRAEHLAEIGQLAASLAHEIKNPLAGISGAIQIIGDTLAPENPHREIIADILRQIARLDATVKDLLLYARPIPPAFRQTRLDELVVRVLSVLREEPAMQRVQVEHDGAVPDATVYIDEGQIEQVLINLILNAAQASPNGATVKIAVRADESRSRLLVRDFGAGMLPEVFERALEPFFTTKAQGTGLGLTICRRIVEAHGGTLSLDSTPGKGTTVTVDLPRAPGGDTKD